MRNVLVQVPHPYPSLNICVGDHAESSDVWVSLCDRLPTTLLQTCRLRPTFRRHDGRISRDTQFTLSPALLGGKGGFGSQLRAAGGRKSGSAASVRSAMKDTSGRRLRTLHLAQSLATQLASAPDRERAARDEKRKRLSDILHTESSRKVLFDDEGYLQDSERILGDIKTALEDTLREAEDEEDEGEAERSVEGGTSNAVDVQLPKLMPRRLHGWDDEDDDLDDSSGEEEEQEEMVRDSSSKGKAAAINKHLDKRRKAVA